MIKELSEEEKVKQEDRAVANMYGVMTNNPAPFINIQNGITKINIAAHDHNDGRDEAIKLSLQTLGIENSPTEWIDARKNEGVARYILKTPTATNAEPMKLVVKLTEEAVKILNDKFHEYGLNVPMLDVALNGKTNQQENGADKFRSKFKEQLNTRSNALPNH